jgi:hypothetical protein
LLIITKYKLASKGTQVVYLNPNFQQLWDIEPILILYLMNELILDRGMISWKMEAHIDCTNLGTHTYAQL